VSLKEISLNRKQRSERMDETAATLLLQSFLDETQHG
jgi:RNase H-fold protein (predicted Holliday junction resolvase)